jgi:hypothetical protein
MTLARTSILSSSSLLALTLALCATGCEVDQKLGDLDATDTDDPPTSSGEDTGNPVPLCPDNPEFTCTVPLDCENELNCGGPLAEVDAEGCLRPRCDGGACPNGYTCVHLSDWGSCAASFMGCEADGDQCSCGGTADCSDSVSICVQDEVAPPAACNSFTDEASCLAAGCSAFVLAPVVEYDEAAGTCSCAEAEPEPTCLWFPSGNQGGDDVITPYYAYDSDGIQMRLLPASYDETPLGWHECSDVFDAETCACAQALSCA